MTNAFTHLRAHTEYSIVESTLRVSELIASAKADGQPAVAMTDLDGFFGAIRFYEAARSAGIKPIIGTDIQIALEAEPAPLDANGSAVDPNPNAQPARRVNLIAKDYQGYKKIMRLITRGYTTNLQHGKPVIEEAWLHEEGPAGIICLSGTDAGHIGAPAVLGDASLAAKNARQLQSIFGDNLYIEVQRRGAPADELFVQACSDIAAELSIPLVATHPMQFNKQEDYVVHELKVCDVRKEIMPDRNRARDFTPHQHFTTTAEMSELFADMPEALDNARALAASCTLDIPLGHPELPNFDTGTDESLSDFFVRVSNEGLARRMKKLYPDDAARSKAYPEYQSRLDHEISTIKKMGFEGYFMIVYDFIKWSSENDVPVGPGRGSGAGSLVAYSLGITDLDPLHYNLLFERFLNPERVSMPDFDIDFCPQRRELVIDYVTKKYGESAVAGITAYGTLAARASVKAAGRALGMNIMMVNGVSSLIPNKPGTDVSVHNAVFGADTDKLSMDPVTDLRERYDNEPEVQRLLDHAITLEGLPKSVGKHAAGVVIAPGRIADFSPVYVPEGETKITTQYDKDDIEKAGLVKFDFLGLTSLTMIDKACQMIRKMPGQENFVIADIPLDDADVYKMFQDGDTLKIFQFESTGMQSMLRDSKPTCIEDLTALNALYRPGPMDLIPEYVRNKANPGSIQYIDPRIQPILKETYGIMVYQEQVMQMAQVIGGYSLGGADLLRRAMGKKKVEEMAHHRQIFTDGAAKNGISAPEAQKIFNHMEKFAGYGFNKSHSAAYSIVAYQTAYLKVKFPAAFFAAVLTVEAADNPDDVPKVIRDANTKGIQVIAPDINTSMAEFTTTPAKPNGLIYGLSGLKGVGIEAVQQILTARDIHGDFSSLEDFMMKCSKCVPPSGVNLVNKTVCERLIMSGAFDSLHENRFEAIAAFPLIQKYNADVAKRAAKLEGRKTENALGDLFALSGIDPAASTKKPKKPKVEKPIPEVERYEWPIVPQAGLMEKLENEKKAFGFYFSDHPMAHYRTQLGDLKACEPIEDLVQGYPSRDELHLVAGVISDLKTFEQKNGKGKMVKGEISDGTASVKFMAWADTYTKVKDWLKKDSFAVFKFQIKEDTFSGQGENSYVAEDILSMSDAQMFLAERLNISIPEDKVTRLREIVKANPGQFPISLWHPDPVKKHVPSAQPPMSISLDNELLDQLRQEFGAHVKIGYPKDRVVIKPEFKPKKAWKK